jgi:hypothetical protein
MSTFEKRAGRDHIGQILLLIIRDRNKRKISKSRIESRATATESAHAVAARIDIGGD